MKENKLIFTVLVLTVLLLLSWGFGAAQGPETSARHASQSPGLQARLGAQAPMGPAFTYQGRLGDDGNPLTSSCDFSFSLWDDASAGSQIGADSVITGVVVSDGYFTTLVNAGGEFGVDAFDGEACWLQVAVQCKDDPDLVILDPRQAVTAAPYASYAEQVGPHEHWGESWSGNGTGLILTSTDSDGLSAQSAGDSVAGVYGYNSGSGYGVFGRGQSGTGVYGTAPTYGLYGLAIATSSVSYGVYGRSDSTQGRGVSGVAGATSGSTSGVYGSSSSAGGYGVYGYNSSGGYGMFGSSVGGDGVAGEAAGDEKSGVYGNNTGVGYGVFGRSADGTGVYGYATSDSNYVYGVSGLINSTQGAAVFGQATAGSGLNAGVSGMNMSSMGVGVYGHALAITGASYGVRGRSDSPEGTGVYGRASADTGTTYGVFGEADSPNGYGGYFAGNVHVLGTLSKSGGSFKIDHPLDPANRYLSHSFVESPDMMNVYNGNVVLDESGTAWVELPDWFEALNGEFRYQLTPIGAPAPDLYIAHKIEDNRFQIAGGSPGLEVSWQVTGVRQDPWAEANRIPVEEDKPEGELGTYLYPELYDQPEELGLNYQRHQGWEEPVGEANEQVGEPANP